jgi:hypothetical protein
VTGVRHDAYAKAHPLVVEQAKNSRERGLYKHPELYGQPLTKGIAGSHHPFPVVGRVQAAVQGPVQGLVQGLTQQSGKTAR